MQVQHGLRIAVTPSVALTLGLLLPVPGITATPNQALQATPRMVEIHTYIVESTLSQARKHPQLDALLKAGGKIIAAPTVRTTDGQKATFESAVAIPYFLDAGEKTPDPKVHTVKTGLTVQLVPQVNQDGTVRVDLAVDNTELAPSGAPATVKHGISNSRSLTAGVTSLFGTWTEGKNIFSVFVRAEQTQQQQTQQQR